jgi:hypothetical protein
LVSGFQVITFRTVYRILNSLVLAAATGTQDVFSVKVALVGHLLAQLNKVTDLLIPLAHVSLQHLQIMMYQLERFTSKR